MLTTNQKGAIAEAKVLAAAIELGVSVAIPVADERYDLIFDLGDRMLRVQCKWATRHSGVVSIRIRRCRRGRSGLIHRVYRPGEIDAVAAYCPAIDRTYLLPLELSVDRANVSLRLEPTRNNQRSGVLWAQDFEFGATLAKLRGPIAQLGERVRGTHEAAGSSPAGSTVFSS